MQSLKSETLIARFASAATASRRNRKKKNWRC